MLDISIFNSFIMLRVFDKDDNTLIILENNNYLK